VLVAVRSRSGVRTVIGSHPCDDQAEVLSLHDARPVAWHGRLVATQAENVAQRGRDLARMMPLEWIAIDVEVPQGAFADSLAALV
jgi:hypothetical protein